jgi:hypothetical protein
MVKSRQSRRQIGPIANGNKCDLHVGVKSHLYPLANYSGGFEQYLE